MQKKRETDLKSLKDKVEKILSDPKLTDEQKNDQMLQAGFESVLEDYETGAMHYLLHSILYDSDRGSFLIAASVIDNELREILSAFFQSRSSIGKKDLESIFEGVTAPLQSTSAKIKIAFANGLISSSLKDCMQAIQRIRSKRAAHTKEPFEIKKEDCNDIASNLPKLQRDSFEEKIKTQLDLYKKPLGYMNNTRLLSDAKIMFLILMESVLSLLSYSTNKP